MRQKKIKYATKETMNEKGVIIEPKIIEHDHIHLEIGSGKGMFITSLAKDHPDQHFVAMEVNISVCYRILEKKETMGLKNLDIILGDAKNLLLYFKPHSVKEIFLNFSDPWPKKRHHKRRLTHDTFLSIYKALLCKHGLLSFKTDHEEFFNDSIEYISRHFELKKLDQTQHYVMQYETEYELKKKVHGKIYRVIAGVKK